MNFNTKIQTVKTLYRVVGLVINTLRHKKYNEANSVRTQSLLIYFLLSFIQQFVTKCPQFYTDFLRASTQNQKTNPTSSHFTNFSLLQLLLEVSMQRHIVRHLLQRQVLPTFKI
jgi:hypothetical protein